MTNANAIDQNDSQAATDTAAENQVAKESTLPTEKKPEEAEAGKTPEADSSAAETTGGAAAGEAA